MCRLMGNIVLQNVYLRRIVHKGEKIAVVHLNVFNHVLLQRGYFVISMWNDSPNGVWGTPKWSQDDSPEESR